MKEMLDQEHLWYPLAFLGITHPLSALNSHTIINTWIGFAVIIGMIIAARYALRRPHTISGYVIRSLIKGLVGFIEQTVGFFVYRYYLFTGSLFIYIFINNIIALIPTVEESTKDLNTTLALGIVAFLFTQKEMIRAHGIGHYLKEYFMPFNIIFPLNLIVGIALLPLKLLGEVASVISLSFRLFGNIFGGSIINGIFQQALSGSILFQTLALFSGLGLLITFFFIIFEGFLQAFIFSILSLTTIAMATAQESGK